MPKEITCAICKKIISRRQSLSIGNSDRACRGHQEVKDYLEKKNQKDNEDEKKKSI
jgi:hypothetical protein